MHQQVAMRSDLTDLLPIKIVTKAVQLQWRVFTLPWTTFLYWLSCVASLLMRFLVFTGSPPAEFYSKAKVCRSLCLPERFTCRQYGIFPELTPTRMLAAEGGHERCGTLASEGRQLQEEDKGTSSPQKTINWSSSSTLLAVALIGKS